MVIPKLLRQPWPFGALKILHWLCPLLIIVCISPLPSVVRDEFPSLSFVVNLAWCAFVTSAISWAVLLLNWQQKTPKWGGERKLVPFLAVDFFFAMLYTLPFAISVFVSLGTFYSGFPIPYCCSEYEGDRCYSKGAAEALVAISSFACLIAAASFSAFLFAVLCQLPSTGVKELSRAFIDGAKIKIVSGIDEETGEIQTSIGEYVSIGDVSD